MLYLLRAISPLGSEKHQAKYYLGYCGEGRLAERLEEHRQGKGAAITRAMMRNGGFVLIGVRPGTRNDERRLKNRKNHKRIIHEFQTPAEIKTAVIAETFTRPDFLLAMAIQACIQGFKRRSNLPAELHPIERGLMDRGLTIDAEIIGWTEAMPGQTKQAISRQFYTWDVQAVGGDDAATS